MKIRSRKENLAGGRGGVFVDGFWQFCGAGEQWVGGGAVGVYWDTVKGGHDAG